MVLLAVGVASILAGGALIAGPLDRRLPARRRELDGAQALEGRQRQPAVPGPAPDAVQVACVRNELADRLRARELRSAGSVPLRGGRRQRHLGTPELAVDGALRGHTADPGQQGNVIIAFHREPDFQYINELNVGDTITIQNRSLPDVRLQGHPALGPARRAKVTQLSPTSGHELTMITCDPWWQDYNRLVWRAELISAPAPSSPDRPADRWPTPPSNCLRPGESAGSGAPVRLREALERARVRLFGRAPRAACPATPDEDDARRTITTTARHDERRSPTGRSECEI